MPVPLERHQDPSDGHGRGPSRFQGGDSLCSRTLLAPRPSLLGIMHTAVLAHGITQHHVQPSATSWLNDNALAMQGAAHVVRQVLATDGIRGLYRGFGIVVVGVIPARGVGLLRHSCIPAACCRRRPAQPFSESRYHRPQWPSEQAWSPTHVCGSVDKARTSNACIQNVHEQLNMHRCTSRRWRPRSPGASTQLPWLGGRLMRLPGPAWPVLSRGHLPLWSPSLSLSLLTSSVSALWSQVRNTSLHSHIPE